uniref:Uncharacterized protein n=1 Tax=Arundo donax TaxID=35708 RepID=A0A0A9AI63_ARUDO
MLGSDSPSSLNYLGNIPGGLDMPSDVADN